MNKKVSDQYKESEQDASEDFTVKVGDWEECFQRSFLRRSPFFDCIFRNEFREVKTGKVEIHLGTPWTVKMALMFQEDHKPELTNENVDTMVALSEFFLIPDLKSYCTQWIKEKQVTEANYFNLLQLASKYDIELPECQRYADGHLLELMEKEEFFVIDSQSLEYIFTERKLSYVSMDAKLLFLIKWTDYDYKRRKQAAKTVATYIDFQDISPDLYSDLRQVKTFTKLFERSTIGKISFKGGTNHEVLLIQNNKKMLLCIDLIRQQLFQLDETSFLRSGLRNISQIVGLNSLRTQVYFREDDSVQTRVAAESLKTINRFDLQTNTLSVLPILSKDREEFVVNPKLFVVNENVCIVIAATHNTWRKILIQERLKSMSGCSPTEKLRCLAHLPKKYDTTEVYVGQICNDHVQLQPLFVFFYERIQKVCLNNESFIFIPETKDRIIIFCFDSHQLETMKIKTLDTDIVSHARDGFVVYNRSRCLCLTKERQKQGTTTRFAVKEVQLLTGEDISYFFCDGWWLRVCRLNLEWTDHKRLLDSRWSDNLLWAKLPVSEEVNQGITLKPVRLFLPRYKLRCALDCPHCEIRRKTEK